MKWVWLNRATVVLACIGIWIAGSLSLQYARAANIPCDAAGGCEAVAQSAAAYVAGVPLAYIGALAYMGLLMLSLIRAFRPEKFRVLFSVGYIVSFLGMVVSLGLTYYSIRVIGQHCIWCIGSAIIMCLTFATYAAMAVHPPRTIAGEGWLMSSVTAIGGVAMVAFVSSLSTKTGSIAYDPIAISRLTYADLVPPKAHELGPHDAPIAVVMFGDLMCPACRNAVSMLKKYVPAHPGTKLVFRHFAIASHPVSYDAAVLTELAAEQGHFWDAVAALYATDLHHREDAMRVAGKFGISSPALLQALASSHSEAFLIVQRDMNLAHRLKFSGTPAIVLASPDIPPRVVQAAQVEATLSQGRYAALLSRAPKLYP